MQKIDFNELETAAGFFIQNEDFGKAICIYLSMADGDSSLDGGYIGEMLGRCYEAQNCLIAANYWFGRAIEENPEVRSYSIQARDRLKSVGIDSIMNEFRISKN